MGVKIWLIFYAFDRPLKFKLYPRSPEVGGLLIVLACAGMFRETPSLGWVLQISSLLKWGFPNLPNSPGLGDMNNIPLSVSMNNFYIIFPFH